MSRQSHPRQLLPAGHRLLQKTVGSHHRRSMPRYLARNGLHGTSEVIRAPLTLGLPLFLRSGPSSGMTCRTEYPLGHSLRRSAQSDKGQRRGLVHADVMDPAIAMHAEPAPQARRFRSASVFPALASCGIAARKPFSGSVAIAHTVALYWCHPRCSAGIRGWPLCGQARLRGDTDFATVPE